MTNRQIRCGSCQAMNRVEPQATRFQCRNCGSMNVISAEQRAKAIARARVGAIITLIVAVVFTIWFMTQIVLR